MSNISNLSDGATGSTLDDMLQGEATLVRREMDPYNAAYHIERMDVAAGNVSDFVRRRRSQEDKINPIWLSEVVILDPCAVADEVASDLGREGKARVMSMVQDLIDHARQYLVDRQQFAPEEIPPSLARALAEFIERSLARCISHPIRSRITLDFAIHTASVDSIR